MFRRRPVRRQRDGRWRIDLSADERALLARLGGELDQLLAEVAAGEAGEGSGHDAWADLLGPAAPPPGASAGEGPGETPPSDDAGPDGLPAGADGGDRDDVAGSAAGSPDEPPAVTNPMLVRLFPSASDDPEADAEYHRLMRTDLLERHRWALETLVRTADAEVLDDAELDAWTAAVNQVRLVLGTAVGVSEDDPPELDESHPEAPHWALYHYLTWLLDTLVDARLATFD